jgi:hypothetical protein
MQEGLAALARKRNPHNGVFVLATDSCETRLQAAMKIAANESVLATFIKLILPELGVFSGLQANTGFHRSKSWG